MRRLYVKWKNAPADEDHIMRPKAQEQAPHLKYHLVCVASLSAVFKPENELAYSQRQRHFTKTNEELLNNQSVISSHTHMHEIMLHLKFRV